MSVENAFQEAIYARLTDQIVGTGKPTLAVRDVGVQAADSGAGGFPYVSIGYALFAIDDTDTSLNFQVVQRVHTWSRSGSIKECKTIQGQVYDALHKHALSVTGWNCYSLLRETSDAVQETDGSFHGVCEYRALLQQAS